MSQETALLNALIEAENEMLRSEDLERIEALKIKRDGIKRHIEKINKKKSDPEPRPGS